MPCTKTVFQKKIRRKTNHFLRFLDASVCLAVCWATGRSVRNHFLLNSQFVYDELGNHPKWFLRGEQ